MLCTWGALGPSNPFAGKTDSVTFSVAISPQAMVYSWVSAQNPTVNVERGWGTGVIQDLYPDASGYLWTAPWGRGTRADVWAGGQLLFVNIPYNQASSSVGTGQPTALDPTERVLLDLSIPNCPRFAGYNSGTQDPHQNATIRGYSIPQTMVTTTYYSVLSLDALYATEDYYPLQATDASRNFKINGGNARFFPDWAAEVGKYSPLTIPQLKLAWSRNTGNQAFSGGQYAMYAQVWGVTYPEGESSGFSTSATAKSIDIFGPTNSMQGYQYAFAICTTDISKSVTDWTGPLVSLMGGIAAPALTTNQFSIAYPFSGAVISMNEATQTADIPIRIFGRPGISYQASWNGGSYTAIGTCGNNGVLNGVLPSQAQGNGTLSVREGSGGTAQTLSNVAIGFNLVALGESNPDGRYDAVALTIPTGSLRKDYINWTGNQGLSEATVATGGLLNVVGDILTFTGGTGTQSTVTVSAIGAGGSVTAVTNNSPASNTLNGSYSVLPTNPITVTSNNGGATPPTLNATWGVSNEYWKLIAQAIYNKYGCVVNVAKSTLGGTTLFNANAATWGNWDPNNPGTGSTSTRMFYQSLGPLLWNQMDFVQPNMIYLDLGLNDASIGTSQSNYYATALNLLAQYQAQLVNSSFTITNICSGADTVTAASQLDAVRAAEIELWNNASGFVAGGSFAHLPFGSGSQNPHFVTQTMKQNAINVVMRYRTASGGSGRAPQFSTASRSGTQLTITCTGGVSPFTHSGGNSEVTGWAVSDANGARTVNTATVSGLVITLTCDATLAAPVSVKWCSGATGVGTTLLDSDLVTPCPPEPFSTTVN